VANLTIAHASAQSIIRQRRITWISIFRRRPFGSNEKPTEKLKMTLQFMPQVLDLVTFDEVLMGHEETFPVGRVQNEQAPRTLKSVWNKVDGEVR
jgi:hypothetical protein